MMNVDIEKAYQAWIDSGRRSAKRFFEFQIPRVGRMEIDFDVMAQDSNRGSRKVQRLGGSSSSTSSSSSSSSSSNAESLAVIVQKDGNLKDLPTNLDRNLRVGAIVEFEVEKRGRLGFGAFRKQVKGKILGKSERRPSHVVVRCSEDDRKYEVPGNRIKIVPLVPLKDIPSWQSEACTTFNSSASSIPVECVVESIIHERDPYVVFKFTLNQKTFEIRVLYSRSHTDTYSKTHRNTGTRRLHYNRRNDMSVLMISR